MFTDQYMKWNLSLPLCGHTTAVHKPMQLKSKVTYITYMCSLTYERHPNDRLVYVAILHDVGPLRPHETDGWVWCGWIAKWGVWPHVPCCFSWLIFVLFYVLALNSSNHKMKRTKAKIRSMLHMCIILTSEVGCICICVDIISQQTTTGRTVGNILGIAQSCNIIILPVYTTACRLVQAPSPTG